MMPSTVVFVGGPDHGRIRIGQHAEILLQAAGALPGNPGAALGSHVQVVSPWCVEQADALGIGVDEVFAILEAAGIDLGAESAYVVESVGYPVILRYVAPDPGASRVVPSRN